jgi:hypothetical protein
MNKKIFDTNENGDILTQGLGVIRLYGAIVEGDSFEMFTNIDYYTDVAGSREFAYKQIDKVLDLAIEKKEVPLSVHELIIDKNKADFVESIKKTGKIFSINGKGVYFTPDMEVYAEILKMIEAGNYANDNTFFSSEDEAKKAGFTRAQ